MMKVDITIGGTMDMARARQSLRKMGDEQAWSNTLKVRSIAALTAMAETLYFARADRAASLHINAVSDGQAVEFQTITNFQEACQYCPSARDQLERASDEFVIEAGRHGDQITLRLK